MGTNISIAEVAKICIYEANLFDLWGFHGLPGPPAFSKPRDTLTWGRDQFRSFARILDTTRLSGLIIYLILFIK